MESMDNTLRKILAAGIGATELGYEKLGEVIDECVKRGEVTMEKGRALNEELKRKCKDAATPSAAGGIDVTKLSDDERAKLLEKLLAMQGEQK